VIILAVDNERIRLDEIIKALFSTSNGVLLRLLNGIFEENFKEDDVEISMENKEFPKENYEDKEIPLIDLIRADFLAKFTEKVSNKKHYYHIEFQIKNDNDMIIRTFEYGFNYAKEVARTEGIDRNVLYFPKQRVIYMEENRNIEDILNMTIIFPNSQEVNYFVPVIKYWKYDIDKLKSQGMYPLIPLQLFKLRKVLQNIIDGNKENKEELLKEYLWEAKEKAKIIAYTCDELFKDKLIEGSDFHKMLIAVQNLIEYLNGKYFKNIEIEEEVKIMTKTLYDPLVEQKGMEKEKENSRLKDIRRIKNFLFKKFGKLNNDYSQKIESLDSDKLDLIIENILDIEKIDDIENYF